MNVSEHIQQTVQQHGGYVGAGGTGAGLAGFLAAAEPWMKLITFSLTTTVAILTIIWTVKRLRAKKLD